MPLAYSRGAILDENSQIPTSNSRNDRPSVGIRGLGVGSWELEVGVLFDIVGPRPLLALARARPASAAKRLVHTHESTASSVHRRVCDGAGHGCARPRTGGAVRRLAAPLPRRPARTDSRT